MILFIDENGNTFKGAAPYIHWINGQLSVGLWHTLKLMILTTSQTIQTSELEENSIFKFIKPRYYSEAYDQDLAEISARQIISVGTAVTIDEDTWYVHQILLVCESDNAGEFIEEFAINEVPTPISLRDFDGGFNYAFGPPVIYPSEDSYDSINVRVGVDLYGENEVLAINLSNRGLELPMSIQKAFLENNIKESYTDFALINRKFKELVSNFIDVVDNKGSYKSLYNSLKWFEWGKNAKLYEIWKNDGPFLEKELTPLLSERYHDLLFTHQKTTHLSLVASLQEMSDDEIDDERNPMLEDIAYQWSVDELALKVSLLGAFFERYFMPIHLDLKRACIEALVYTHQVKALPGTSNDKYHIHDDTGVIDIEMDHTVVLGNIPFVAVGKDTMFAKRVPCPPYDNPYYIDPVGVESLENIKQIYGRTVRNRDFNQAFNQAFGPATTSATYEYTTPGINDSIATLFTQLKAGVGVIIPIKVSVDLPAGDGLITEVLTVYGWNDGVRYVKEQVTERRLFKSVYDETDNKWKASFTFNLLSTQEETISFSLALYSLSGHAWTGASSYKVIDVSGSYLDVCVVRNTYNGPSHDATYNSVEEWINQTKNPYSQDNKNPYARLYEYLDYDPNDPDPSYDNVLLTQYIPYDDDNLKQYNQLIVVENTRNGQTQDYNIGWINSNITNEFWVIYRSDSYNPHYVMLISKDPGVQYSSAQRFIDSMGITGMITTRNIKRFDPIFIPQLHLYESLESKDRSITYNNYCFGETSLLCVIPQFKKNVQITHISWKFKNMTTLEEIELNQPAATPLIASVRHEALSPGFWTVTMYYKLDSSSELHELSKNSAFKIITNYEDSGYIPYVAGGGTSGSTSGSEEEQKKRPGIIEDTAYWVSKDQNIKRTAYTRKGTRKSDAALKLGARTTGKVSCFTIVNNEANATVIEYGYYGEGGKAITTYDSVSSGDIEITHNINPGINGEYSDYIRLEVPENTSLSPRKIEIAYSATKQNGGIIEAGSIIIIQASAAIVQPRIVQVSNMYSPGQVNYIDIDNPSILPYRLKLGSGSSNIIQVTRLDGRLDLDKRLLTETLSDVAVYETERLKVRALPNDNPGGDATVILTKEDGTELDIYTAVVSAPVAPYDPDNPDEPIEPPVVPPVEESEGELVDLGLPSGTLWMDRNIGASAENQKKGVLFAWGETAYRNNFDVAIYGDIGDPDHILTDSHNNPVEASGSGVTALDKTIPVLIDYQNYVRNIDLKGKSYTDVLSNPQRWYWINQAPETQPTSNNMWWTAMGRFEMSCLAGYLKNASMSGGNIKSTPWDAASVHYHDLRLCMPTTYQYYELCTYCTITAVTPENGFYQGVPGYQFTSNQNGASIFIPCNSAYSRSWQDPGDDISYTHTYDDYAVLWLANGGTRNGSVMELYTDTYKSNGDTIVDVSVKHNASSYGMYFGANIRACTSGRRILYDRTNNSYTFNSSGNHPYFNVSASGNDAWDVIKIVPRNDAIINEPGDGTYPYKDYYKCIPDALTVFIGVSDPCNEGWYPVYGGPQTRTGSGDTDTRNGRSGTNEWTPFTIEVTAADNIDDVGGDIADQSHPNGFIPEGGKFYGNGTIALSANGYHLGRYYLKLLDQYNGTTARDQNLIWIGGSGMDYEDYSDLTAVPSGSGPGL